MPDFTQTNGEEISYKIDTTNWGGSPTNVAVKAYLRGNDVTDTVFPTNDPSVSGDDINLSPLKNLSGGVTYEIRVQFTSGGNILKKTMCVACD